MPRSEVFAHPYKMKEEQTRTVTSARLLYCSPSDPLLQLECHRQRGCGTHHRLAHTVLSIPSSPFTSAMFLNAGFHGDHFEPRVDSVMNHPVQYLQSIELKRIHRPSALKLNVEALAKASSSASPLDNDSITCPKRDNASARGLASLLPFR